MDLLNQYFNDTKLILIYENIQNSCLNYIEDYFKVKYFKIF